MQHCRCYQVATSQSQVATELVKILELLQLAETNCSRPLGDQFLQLT